MRVRNRNSASFAGTTSRATFTNANFHCFPETEDFPFICRGLLRASLLIMLCHLDGRWRPLDLDRGECTSRAGSGRRHVFRICDDTGRLASVSTCSERKFEPRLRNAKVSSEFLTRPETVYRLSSPFLSPNANVSVNDTKRRSIRSNETNADNSAAH